MSIGLKNKPHYPPKNYGCSKHRTGYDKHHTDYLDNTYQTGLVGTRYFQYLMAQRNIVAEYIDFTYDVILPENKYSIEIKTRRASKYKGDIRGHYAFGFNISQVQKDAFDYAVCFGLDDKYNVKAVYVIPQIYIYQKAKMMNKLKLKGKYRKNTNATDTSIITIQIPESQYPKDGPRQICRHFDTYDNWQICRDRLEVFDINNKTTFTKTKNKIYKDIVNYYEERRYLLYLKIKDLWDKGKSTTQISKELSISKNTITKYKKEYLELKPELFTKTNSSKIYRYIKWESKHEEKINRENKNMICKKCNYTTNSKSKMLKHFDRKTPCHKSKYKRMSKNDEDLMEIKELGKGYKNREYTCKTCNYKTKDRRHIYRHLFKRKTPCKKQTKQE
jgi:hypothetical protein